jgi:hypothetical protein
MNLPIAEKPKAVKAKKDAEIAIIPGNPLALRGAKNIRTLTAAFIADLQDKWEKHGVQVIDIIIEKNPELFFMSVVKLAQIIRVCV